VKRDWLLFLKDITEAMDAIQKFTEGMSFEEFIRDDKTASAVIRKFEVIGEATKHIPDQIREKHSQIPWKRMAGIRDRLIHGYFGIDYKLVWDAIRKEIPRTKPLIQSILQELSSDQELYKP